MLEQHGLIRRVIKSVYVAAQVPDDLTTRARALHLVVPREAVVTDWTACWFWTGVLKTGDHRATPPAVDLPHGAAPPPSQRSLRERRTRPSPLRHRRHRRPPRHHTAPHRLGPWPARSPRQRHRSARRPAAARVVQPGRAAGRRRTLQGDARRRTASSPGPAGGPAFGVARGVDAAASVARHPFDPAADAAGLDHGERRRGLPHRPGCRGAAVRLRVRRRRLPPDRRPARPGSVGGSPAALRLGRGRSPAGERLRRPPQHRGDPATRHPTGPLHGAGVRRTRC